MSSANGLIWIFVAFVVFIELVSGAHLSDIYLLRFVKRLLTSHKSYFLGYCITEWFRVQIFFNYKSMLIISVGDLATCRSGWIFFSVDPISTYFNMPTGLPPRS